MPDRLGNSISDVKFLCASKQYIRLKIHNITYYYAEFFTRAFVCVCVCMRVNSLFLSYVTLSTNKLNPWSRDLAKLTLPHPGKKSISFYGTKPFITVLYLTCQQ
jgi:hypothetical protein